MTNSGDQDQLAIKERVVVVVVVFVVVREVDLFEL